MSTAAEPRIPVLYLAPWVDVGGADKGTVDWFRHLDRNAFAPSLITTQPSANRRLAEVAPYAEEVWELPELMLGEEFARFIVTFIHTRAIKVVQIMHSRIGFELLPDIARLPERPRVVVQHHLDVPDGGGYVGYVATRYGNLVDAYSVSSEALSNRLAEYGVWPGKRRVIPTGVDAEREFCPAQVRPQAGLDPSVFHILYPARLSPQKDPLLMLEVAAALRARGVRFRLHVVGDGELASAVRARIDALRLGESVALHGERLDIAPWYAACDAVLMTSAFEGLPYVIYEAMAMATPIIAPDLGGASELVTPGTGVLVSPRDDVAAYATALAALAADPDRRAEIGAAARARVRAEFSLQRMAADHAALYEELLARASDADGRGSSADGSGVISGAAPPASFRRRRPREAPLVSVIVPCFNQGHYLGECLQSIKRQSYAPIETIVVDDGSNDPDTLTVLDALAAEGTVELVRLGANRGPGAARNGGVDRARGRYVLPLDADDLLTATAIGTLVEQLRTAGEQIGFVYPTYQLFGNRSDLVEPPSYNLHALLGANFCQTSALFDREVFDAGLRYSEDLTLGHEDWDFFLALGERGIYGLPARETTLLYRKYGFSRSDLVDATDSSFGEVVARRHPALFEPRSRSRLKADWSPAVSVIALAPLPEMPDVALRNLVAAAAGQSCEDFELVIFSEREPWPTELGGRLRRVPRALTGSRAQSLALGVQVSRGRYVLASYGSVAALLSDRTLIEKTLRLLAAGAGSDVLALAEGDATQADFGLLHGEGLGPRGPDALCWPALGPTAPPPALRLAGDAPLETLARWFGTHATVRWRKFARRDRQAVAAPGAGPVAEVGAPVIARAADARLRATESPLVPGLPPGVGDWLAPPRIWMPPQTAVLCRHKHRTATLYAFTNDRASPPGFVRDRDLGCVRRLPLLGTASLAVEGDGASIRFVRGQHKEPDAPGLLGFVEEVPLPLLDTLWVGSHRQTGQEVLVAGEDDPLADCVEELRLVGYLEPYPIRPRQLRDARIDYGLLGLLRAIDLSARRHRYAAGQLPGGVLVGELGAMFAEPTGDCDPLWIEDDGYVHAGAFATASRRPSIAAALRWAGDPLRWPEAGPLTPRLRSSARRLGEAAAILATRSRRRSGAEPVPAGYLLREPTAATVPLYGAIHPVTSDQLLSTSPAEPRDLGYADASLIGHLIARAPVTGALGITRREIPWATRWGR